MAPIVMHKPWGEKSPQRQLAHWVRADNDSQFPAGAGLRLTEVQASVNSPGLVAAAAGCDPGEQQRSGFSSGS